MSFDNFYPNRKDWRKPYKGIKAVDARCRNHQRCHYCQRNRSYRHRKELERVKDLEEFYNKKENE